MLKVHQLVDSVCRGETICQMILMLIQSAPQVVGHTDIEDGVVPIGEDIYIIHTASVLSVRRSFDALRLLRMTGAEDA